MSATRTSAFDATAIRSRAGGRRLGGSAGRQLVAYVNWAWRDPARFERSRPPFVSGAPALGARGKALHLVGTVRDSVGDVVPDVLTLLRKLVDSLTDTGADLPILL